jgi:hypothetical protein
MPAVAIGKVLKTVDSREVKLYAALLANNTAPSSRVAPVNVTLGGAVTASDTATATITDITPGIAMQVGQPILFRDAAGSYIATVRTLFTTGTSLEIIAKEDIPNGAVAVFPPEVDLVTGHSLDTQTSTNNVSTYQHTGQGEVSRGDTTRTVQFSALKSYYSAGQETALYAIENEQDLYMELHDPNPDSDTFTTNPPIRWFSGIASAAPETGNNGDKLSLDFTMGISGSVNKVDPS